MTEAKVSPAYRSLFTAHDLLKRTSDQPDSAPTIMPNAVSSRKKARGAMDQKKSPAGGDEILLRTED